MYLTQDGLYMMGIDLDLQHSVQRCYSILRSGSLDYSLLIVRKLLMRRRVYWIDIEWVDDRPLVETAKDNLATWRHRRRHRPTTGEPCILPLSMFPLRGRSISLRICRSTLVLHWSRLRWLVRPGSFLRRNLLFVLVVCVICDLWSVINLRGSKHLGNGMASGCFRCCWIVSYLPKQLEKISFLQLIRLMLEVCPNLSSQ